MRFSAYVSDKTVYVWRSDLAIHTEVRANIGLPVSGKKLVFWQNGTGMLDGVAEKSGDVYVMASSDCFTQGFIEYQSGKRSGKLNWAKDVTHSLADVLDQDWSWVNHYIKVDAWLNNMKESVNTALADLGDPRRIRE